MLYRRFGATAALFSKVTLFVLFILVTHHQQANAQAEINTSKTLVTKRLTDFGAKPNDTIDDSEALQKACAWFSNPANINYVTSYGKLIIPSGTFIVGKQKINSSATDPNGYTQQQYPARIDNVDGLIIEGEPGARLKLADNLLFGYFNSSGQPVTTENFSNQAYTGEVIMIKGGSKNVLIQNLEIDGNSDNYKLGGSTGTSAGFQCIGYGLYIEWAQFITLKNLYIHKFGADNVYIILPSNSTTYSDGSIRWNMIVDNIRADSAGRNCLTWVQGVKLKVTNSKLRWASGGKAISAPGACIDIETDVGAISDGLFENCTLQTSYLYSPLNIGGYRPNNNITFKGCIINSDMRSPAIQTSYSKSRVYNFENCTISGSIITKRPDSGLSYFDNNGRTSFTNCTITQVNPNAHYGSLILINDLCLFDNCTFSTKNFSFFNVSPAIGTTSIPVNNYSILRNCKFITDKSTQSGNSDWGYAQYLRFEGNTTFSLTNNSITQNLHSRRTFINNIIAGTKNPDQRDVFTIDPFTFTQQYEGTSLTLGADEHSKVDFVITDKSIYDDFKKELVVNKNARIIVKAGGTLMFRAADVKLFGQIIVESGGFLFIDDKTIIKTCSGLNDNNIIMNGTFGAGYNLWRPENPKANPLAISGSLPGCTNNFVANVTTCINLGDVCSSSSTDVKSLTFSVNAAGNYSLKLKEKVSSSQIKVGNNAWNVYNATQSGVNDFKEFTIGTYALSTGNNTIQLSSSNGPVCYRELCATSVSAAGGRMAATESDSIVTTETLLVFPNPNQGQFEVRFQLENGKTAILTVSDIQGKGFYEQSIVGQGQHSEKIRLPEGAVGTFIVQLRKEKITEVQRMIVSR